MSEVVAMNEGELNRCINKMFLSFPSVTQNRVARIEVYAEALSRIPLRYAQEACEFVMRGKLNGSSKFLPSAGEVRQLAETLQQRAVNGTPAKWVAVPWPAREPEEFNPKAKLFCPYSLGMTKDEIMARLKEENS